MPWNSSCSPSGVISSTFSEVVAIVSSIHCHGSDHEAGHGKRGFGSQVGVRDGRGESCAAEHAFDVRLGVAVAAVSLDAKFNARGGRNEFLEREHEQATGPQRAAGGRGN